MCVLVSSFSFDYNAGKEKKHYCVRLFTTPEDAVAYLDTAIDQKTVGFGDSRTLQDMGLYAKLAKHNIVHDPNRSKDNPEFLEIAKNALTTEVFLTSVNALTETGEMVNLDGTGNRVAGSLFGHERVYFVIGRNKIVANLEEAIQRTRNIAAPQNALRFNFQTPCAKTGGSRCYDCMSPARICNAMVIYFQKMNDLDVAEVILIDADMEF